jgi:hypothetical protein
MMVAELEIWRAAALVIKRYGAAAETEADKRAEILLDHSDREGVVLWLRIKRAIVDWQAGPTGPAH